MPISDHASFVRLRRRTKPLKARTTPPTRTMTTAMTMINATMDSSFYVSGPDHQIPCCEPAGMGLWIRCERTVWSTGGSQLGLSGHPAECARIGVWRWFCMVPGEVRHRVLVVDDERSI